MNITNYIRSSLILLSEVGLYIAVLFHSGGRVIFFFFVFNTSKESFIFSKNTHFSLACFPPHFFPFIWSTILIKAINKRAFSFIASTKNKHITLAEEKSCEVKAYSIV